MKKKKWLIISLFVIVFVVIISIFINNNRNTVNKVMFQLEQAINNNDIETIISLYPDYYKDTIINILSEEKIKEFNNEVGEIKIEISRISDYESISETKDIQDEIYNKYKANVDIKEYQIVIANVTNDVGYVFEQVPFEIVKINGKYYLYADVYQGDLIQCFMK